MNKQLTHWTQMPNSAMQAEVPQGGWPIDWDGYARLLEENGGDEKEVYVSVLEASAELLKAGDVNQASYFYAQAQAWKIDLY